MKRTSTTIDNTDQFWVKLCNHDPKKADKKLREGEKVNHKYLSNLKK